MRAEILRAPAAALAPALAAIFAAGCGGSGDGGGMTPLVGPQPTAEIAADRTLVKAGAEVAFALVVDGIAPSSYAWDFGDGEILDGAAVPAASHSFAAEGTYVVSASAADDYGNSVAASVTIEVTPAGGAPVLTVESVELHCAVADATPCEVTVNGAGPVELVGGEFTWRDALDASPGTYEVRAVDEGGNSTTRTVTITLLD